MRQVQSKSIKSITKGFVSAYFRSVKPELTSLALKAEVFATLDGHMEELLLLAQKNALRTSYLETVKAIDNGLKQLEISCIMSPPLNENDRSSDSRQGLIAETLKGILPTAGLSYEQTCVDLADKKRKSYRGPAAELRESLRETLDYFAPDDKVTAESGFKYESGLKKPTMKQKVGFILRSRGKSKGISKTPENTVDVVEDKIGTLARSVYQRTSISTHVTTTRKEVLKIKGYIDSVLAELLEIH